jgi:RNA binding exosome subunit
LGLKININAGNHDRIFCPVSFSLTKKQLAEKGIESFVLLDENDREVPYQTVDFGEQIQIALLVEHLEKGKQVSYKLSPGKPTANVYNGVKLSQQSSKVDIDINGEYFSSYVFDKQFAKPYLGPIKLSEGNDFTRLDFDIKEHPHHRSIWIAIGDVNGVDFWNEPAGVYGKQHHQSFSELNSGAVYGSLTAKNVWTNYKDTPIIDEERTFTFYNTPKDRRILDVKVVFHAKYGQVEFGATKEAGPLGVRMSEKLKADNGGTMINSYGGIGEAECWGRQAHWCDYYGESNGQLLGIAAFDNPNNMDFPTHWHIRDYGLMAPNNFYFLGGKLLKPNDVVEYKYRLFFHSDDTKVSGVEQQYHNYINPPRVMVE